MSILSFFKKKKEDKTKMSTLDEVRKAYEDLSEDDKKSFHQTIADRVHESIAAQERESGDEDSQSAEAREHEALGAEHADGEGETDELHETDDTAEEEREDEEDKERQDLKDDEQDLKDDIPSDRISKLEARFDSLEKMLSESLKKQTVDDKAKEVYGLGNGVFQANEESHDTKKVSGAEIASILAKIKR